jgi:hypothetical protein
VRERLKAGRTECGMRWMESGTEEQELGLHSEEWSEDPYFDAPRIDAIVTGAMVQRLKLQGM